MLKHRCREPIIFGLFVAIDIARLLRLDRREAARGESLRHRGDPAR
jgi:hypothetical protein